MVFAPRFRFPFLPSTSALVLRPLRAGQSERRSFLSYVSLAVLASGAVFATACGVATFIVQQYEGEPLSAERIAILRINGDASVRLEELDGEVLAYELHDRGSRVHIEMLPGEHEIGLADGSGLPIKRRRFVAEAGKVYRPMVFHKPSPPTEAGWAVAIYEVERDTDAILREISQVASATATAAPGSPGGGATSASGLGDAPSSPPSAAAPAATPSSNSPRATTPVPSTSTTPAPSPPDPGLDRDVTPTGLPNTTANTTPGVEQAPALAPSPVPPGVSPAKGPATNPPPPEATPQ